MTLTHIEGVIWRYTPFDPSTKNDRYAHEELFLKGFEMKSIGREMAICLSTGGRPSCRTDGRLEFLRTCGTK